MGALRRSLERQASRGDTPILAALRCRFERAICAVTHVGPRRPAPQPGERATPRTRPATGYDCRVSSISPRRDGRVFDEVAAEYDRSRPAYPDELVTRACQVAGIGAGDPVLEIGCGSGQLTRGLAARGLHVTALEPGERLLALAERNLAGIGQVEFAAERFEDAQLPSSHFRAAFSASAFHWLEPEVSWQKAARLLAPGGTLALLQCFGLAEERSAGDLAELLSALAKIAPEVAADWPSYRDLAATVAGAERRRENVSEVWAWLGCHDVARAEAGSLFRDVRIAATPILLEQSARELNELLRTASFYQHISASQRRALEREHTELYARLGRPIRSSTVAVLVTARRATGS
jgi:SAM-dependent methyltransferase